MRVTLIRTHCDDKPICPAVWRTDRGTTIVQGYVTSWPNTVEVPALLVTDMDGFEGTVTDRGTMLVTGALVTDREALEMMNIPEGESAVELPAAVRKADMTCLTTTS
jgi:hypothetical protein